MKKLLFIATLFVSIAAFAQTKAPLEFASTKYSFGKIKQGTPVTTEFKFTNNGDKPAIIETATAECGCTTPDYPKTPIMKGKTGVIKVTYNAAAMGAFTKHVNVKVANTPEPIVLTIDGEVVTTAKTGK
ncbi:DUF1573 domain-containing protein [Deminuibacter soli]|uniref:DUF1573 domain-containing protein n=1 Tax=Deminuibacter soli TaxID=2291815 RepID=A0A3E1NDR8_9BACT|nr:DUF1573 domain-containing protein [Deminuibacter soli]RFM26012.1 DUF1573 domain-containing protein [Deminuibacter soli]